MSDDDEEDSEEGYEIHFVENSKPREDDSD